MLLEKPYVVIKKQFSRATKGLSQDGDEIFGAPCCNINLQYTIWFAMNISFIITRKTINCIQKQYEPQWSSNWTLGW
jgi:hypothetical protein